MEIKDLFKNKKYSIIILAIGIIIIGILSYFLFSYRMGAYYTTSEFLPYMKAPSTIYPESKSMAQSETLRQQEYEIKTGYAEIKSENSEKDYDNIKEKVEEIDGWTESFNKYEGYDTIRVQAIFKVPSKEFEGFADWIIKNFDVKNTNFGFYRVSVERQQEEIEILLQALESYNKLMSQAELMSLNETKLEMIFRITEKKLEVMRLLKMYGYSIKEIEKQANYSSVTIVLVEDKPIKIMPEDKGKDLMMKIRNSVNEIVNALIDLLTVPFVIIVKIFVYIIYAIIALIPIYIAYKIIIRIFKRLGKKF